MVTKPTGRPMGRPPVGSGYKLGPLPVADELRDALTAYADERGIKMYAGVRDLLELGLAAAKRGGRDGQSAANRIREALEGLQPGTPDPSLPGDGDAPHGWARWEVSGADSDDVRSVWSADLETLLRFADPTSAPTHEQPAPDEQAEQTP